jgi:HEAT repeat protein
MGVEICFDSYLRSLIKKDERSQDGYTQTDVANLVDFGLMVQTIQEQEKRQEGKESQDSEQEKSKIARFPVLDGIRKYAADHVLLVGRPGSGKSTALRKMLVDEAQKVLDGQSSLIPVLIELRSWRTSYIALIKDFFRVHKLRLEEATIDDLLFEGKLLLLVDGVNELPDAKQDIRDFRKANADTPMIFTTRMLGVGGDLEIEKKLEMLALTEPQMRQFVQMRLPDQGKQMLQKLGDRLRKFGDTPLLLSMLCDVFQKNGRVPANLGAAFRDFANLHDGKLKEDVPVYEHSRLWWSKLLQQLAFAMMPQDRPNSLRLSIPRLEAEEILTRFLDGERFPKPRDYAHRWLEDLLKYHLIQVKLVGTDQEIEFRHQLIQEYYAAEYLLPLFPNLTDIKLQHSYLNYLDWTESLALMLELVKNEEQAVRVVRLALDVDLRLGARLAGAVKYVFQEKTVGLLMREIEKWKIPKFYAIELLAETRSDKTVEPLILALKDANDWVRIKAVEALGNIGSDKAVDPLIPTLKESLHDVRCEAAKALGNIGSDKAVDPLIQLFNSDEYLHKEVAEALANIGSDKAVEFLIQLRNSNKCLLENALEVLTNIRSQMPYVPTTETWVSDETIESLILALNDSDDGVRRDAAKALGKIGTEKVVDSLIAALNDSNSKGRGYLAEALGNIGNEKAVDPLIAVLKDADYFDIRQAAQALGKIGTEKVVDLLIVALNDSNSKGSGHLAEALGNIGNEKAVDPLIETLNHSNHRVRRDVAEALGKIGNEKAVDSLLTALNDLDHNVKRSAAEALGKIGNEKAIDPLIADLNHLDIFVRLDAEDALKKITKVDRNLPTLTQQLPHLLTLIPTESSEEALSVITTIQARCKYYNYAIAQTPLQETDTSNITSSGSIIVNIQSKSIYMSDISRPNITISGGQFRDFVAGDKTIHGNEIETQNNYYGTDDPNTQQLANELVEILQGIVPQISDPTSEAGKEIITAAAMEEIENKPTLKDRLVAAFKAGAFEAIKKIAKNDFVEVFLTAFKAGLEAKPKK